VQHLDPAEVIAFAARGRRHVDGTRALRGAENKQRRSLRVEPKCSRAPNWLSNRSRVAIAGRSGTPVTRACSSSADDLRLVREADRNMAGEAHPSRLATPGGTLSSWITSGVLRPPRRQIRRYGDVAPEPDHDIRAHVVEYPRPAFMDRSIRTGVLARFQAHRPRQLVCRHLAQFEAGGRDELALQDPWCYRHT
jgi:hypothetical protein